MASSTGPVVNTFWWTVGTSFEVPIDRLPVTLLNKPSRVLAGLLVFIGSSLLATCLGAGIVIARKEGGATGAAVAVGAVGVGLFGPLLVAGINLFVKRTLIVIDERRVVWEQKSLFRKSQREAPTSEYDGVLFRAVAQREDDGVHEFDVIEMAHADPACSVRLLKAKSGEPTAERWRAYCRRFNLPAIEDVTPRFRITRNLHELETPLLELIRTGRVALPHIPTTPPEGVEIDATPGRTVITLPGRSALVVTERHLQDTQPGSRVHPNGMMYELDRILAFTVEANPWTHKTSIVMTVRQDPPYSAQKRIFLTSDSDLERCIWLHAQLVRAVASNPAV